LEVPRRSNTTPLGMMDRREHGANQGRDQDCGNEGANRRTDDLVAEATGGGQCEEEQCGGREFPDWVGGTILLSLNMPLHFSFEQPEILGRIQRQQML
jgi:hypothetical protein